MLLSLRVKNYALINELLVEFQDGLNIITGETGAGKSILLGALSLILGKRADLSVLMNGDSKCIVEAEFKIENYNLQSVFEESDVDYEENTVFRREILPSGKSRAFINDTPVNLNVMQELALKLVDIHSQHQNLQLNKQEYLLGLIDRYCRNEKLLEEYVSVYDTYRKSQKNYNESLAKYKKIQDQFDYISHQYNELVNANLEAGELLQLESELKELENSGDIKTALNEVENILLADDTGVIDLLAQTVQRLSKLSSVYAKAENYSSRLESTSIELKDLSTEISKSFEHLEFDPQKFEEAKDRLNVINGLLLKYKKQTVEELISLQEELKEKVSVAVDGGFDLEKQKKALDILEEQLKSNAVQLSKKRQNAFSNFEKEILKVVFELGMEHAELSFSHSEQELAINGIDNINFYFSANKNHPLQEVSKIASGGELSRLMLAIKSVLSNTIGMPTLILDEIDTGVSGDIADKVGTIINGVSKGIQVINITHLPQVASKGKSHFLVYKDHTQEVTRTLIRKLTEGERLQEIAKMLSGEELTDAALENARVMLGK